jgi:hypothetical protein
MCHGDKNFDQSCPLVQKERPIFVESGTTQRPCSTRYLLIQKWGEALHVIPHLSSFLFRCFVIHVITPFNLLFPPYLLNFYKVRQL